MWSISFFLLSRCKPRTWLVKPVIQRMHLLTAQKLASAFSYSVYETILIYLGIGPPRTRWCSQPLLHVDGPTLYPVDLGMKWYVPCLLSALPGQGEGCLIPLPPPPFRFFQPTFIYSAWTTVLQNAGAVTAEWNDTQLNFSFLYGQLWECYPIRILAVITGFRVCVGGRLYVCPDSPLSKFLSSFYIGRK